MCMQMVTKKKKAVVAILISDKLISWSFFYFSFSKGVSWDREGHLLMIKGSIHQEVVYFLFVCI